MIFAKSSSKKKKSKLTKAKQKVLDDYNAWRKQNKLPAVTSLNAEKISSSFFMSYPTNIFNCKI